MGAIRIIQAAYSRHVISAFRFTLLKGPHPIRLAASQTDRFNRYRRGENVLILAGDKSVPLQTFSSERCFGSSQTSRDAFGI